MKEKIENNIDKDIEKYFDIKKIPLQDIIRLFKREGIENFVIARREKFENVISEFKETKDTLKCTQDSWYKDTQELEKWKKIAEKLAALLLNGDEAPYVCDIIDDEHCDNYTSDECEQCIIDWARKEVENE